jgi:hypothetical protein
MMLSDGGVAGCHILAPWRFFVFDVFLSCAFGEEDVVVLLA